MAPVSVPRDLQRENYKCVLLFEGISVRKITESQNGTGWKGPL